MCILWVLLSNDNARESGEMNEFEIGFVCQNPTDFEQASFDFYNTFDGLVAQRDALVFVTVELETSEPVRSAIEIAYELRMINLVPIRVDRDLVDASEIASRLDRSRQNIQQWATGVRKSDFPAPVSTIGGKRIWEWADIAIWANGYLDAIEPLSLRHDQSVVVDSSILQRHHAEGPEDLSWKRLLTHATALQSAGMKRDVTYREVDQVGILRTA